MLATVFGIPPRRLLSHDVASTITTLLRSPRRESKLCGLQLLSSLAAGSDAVRTGTEPTSSCHQQLPLPGSAAPHRVLKPQAHSTRTLLKP